MKNNNYIQETLTKAVKSIKENPRKCEICGAVETVDNIMLRYDNGKIMCDDCMLEVYKDFPI